MLPALILLLRNISSKGTSASLEVATVPANSNPDLEHVNGDDARSGYGWVQVRWTPHSLHTAEGGLPGDNPEPGDDRATARCQAPEVRPERPAKTQMAFGEVEVR